MKRWRVGILLGLLALFFLVACGQKPITPMMGLDQAQTAYINAWQTYKAAWNAQPAEIQKAWIKKYDPIFKRAGNLLQTAALNPSNDVKVLLDKALQECDNVLMELMLKKGGK